MKVRLIRPLGWDIPDAEVGMVGEVVEDDGDGGWLVALETGTFWGTYSAWEPA
jgi:hypothetical protein